MLKKAINIVLGLLLFPLVPGSAAPSTFATLGFTHALWALPFGGRLKDFRAGESGGHAVVTRSNVLVALAPYFFPIYAYLVLALFGIFIAVGVREKVFPYICFLTGFTVSFHLLFTGHSLFKKQSDLKKGGILLSLVLILLLNIIFITFS